MNTVQEEHSVDISETVLWTDSKTVLRWIGSTHRRYKQFVGKRVAEILESSKVSQWRWVPTSDNAADDATWSQNKADLSPESRWLSRAAFLKQPASGWPAPERELSVFQMHLMMPRRCPMQHQNVDATIAQNRTRFWVTKMRRVLKEVISSGIECKLQQTRLMPPIMGPFQRIDWKREDGHSNIQDWTIAGYCCPSQREVLFACLTTRAIHLELAHDRSTDSCIIAIRNFVCRSGAVRRLRSDNGKNFVGADREVRRFGGLFQMEQIQRKNIIELVVQSLNEHG
ncbi:uncharacterized protein [Drosophila kikkawai]|uniref:Integrase catalytic domain-containing protein n=1 Tax=Drosophila kikkawai TaxID=30033 RepID=A0ABM4GCL2_DROKI